MSDFLTADQIHHHLDTQGLICPEPVMLLHKSIRQAGAGELIEILATDPATTRDIPNFCRHLGHELLLNEVVENTTNDVSDGEQDIEEVSRYRYVVKKRSA
ncbi:sulfurtransferase TusA [Psychrobacter sp. I-STPA6b]|uniref:sulfurtransferase TusA n=1 Tax=Psychrobacter sp. I-STPA6b TaxID=2585718 RepID=UPI001D0CD722|nr:sulfurtransferase TusA [Psychrobacter sp. I-STPA6b]